ncbi:class I SAM-dependent methyltransferase [Streptomyces cellulosae]
MPEAPEKFDTATTTWQEYQDAPWGRLRYSIAEANLARHLDGLGDGPLRILDLAGGDGGGAMRLAARGHHVTIVDHAPAMLSAATERASAGGLTELITCVQADVAALPADLATGQFDVVLCHNLLQYMDDAPGTLATALAPLKDGGLFSVMAINRHSAALNIIVRQMDPAATGRARHRPVLDPDVRLGADTAHGRGDHLRPARPRLPGRRALRHPRLLRLHHRRCAQVRPGLLRRPRTTGARHHRAPALHAHRAALPADGAEAAQLTDGSSRSSCRHVDRERPKTVARCRCEVAQ